MKVFIHHNNIFKEEKLNGLNKWLVSKGKKPVENPIFQDVPEDCDIKDFVNGYFSQTNYDERKKNLAYKKYKNLVRSLIREKYDQDDELAILRQKDTKPVEFYEYNEFAEQCKLIAKQKINK